MSRLQGQTANRITNHDALVIENLNLEEVSPSSHILALEGRGVCCQPGGVEGGSQDAVGRCTSEVSLEEYLVDVSWEDAMNCCNRDLVDYLYYCHGRRDRDDLSIRTAARLMLETSSFRVRLSILANLAVLSLLLALSCAVTVTIVRTSWLGGHLACASDSCCCTR